MPNKHKRAPLSVRLPEAEEAWLRDYAERWDISIGAALTEAVQALMDREEGLTVTVDASDVG
jgi:hypothetical protein